MGKALHALEGLRELLGVARWAHALNHFFGVLELLLLKLPLDLLGVVEVQRVRHKLKGLVRLEKGCLVHGLHALGVLVLKLIVEVVS
jgi:hypothetical protein